MEAKASPTKWASYGCQATQVTADAVWPGRWARAPSVQGKGSRGAPTRQMALGTWPRGPQTTAARGCETGPGISSPVGEATNFDFPQKKKKKKIRHFPGWATGGATHPHFLESSEQKFGIIVRVSIT